MSFDGDGDYIDIGEGINLDLDWTMSFWVNNHNQHLDTR